MFEFDVAVCVCCDIHSARRYAFLGLNLHLHCLVLVQPGKRPDMIEKLLTGM